ncbi:NAD(P)/FAD-dependent oxidoreductase [Sphingobium chlorophenolicum]|nr:FAD-dependent oxidoreductase [Sphingobium chlorophenolicum]
MTLEPTEAIIEKALSGAKIFPLWLDHPDRPSPQPKLRGVIPADLAIVGGGFTGLWAAIQAKEQDPSCEIVLIEAGEIAFGASGRPGGIVSTSIMHGLKNAVRVFPDDVGELERLGQENLDGFRDTIDRYAIDADFEWNGEMTVAVNDRELPELREEFDLHRKYGHDVEWLDAEAVRRHLNCPDFVGGMWSHERSGTVHPAKLAWGLKAAAISLGVKIFEHTRMDELRPIGAGLRVRTESGEITAHRVFLATNAWGAKQKKVKRRIMAMRDHVLATEPLTDEQLARIGWTERQGIYDTRTELNYLRLTKDNRIVFGGSVGYAFGNDLEPASDEEISTYYALARDFFRKFPALTDVRISHVWGGPIDYCLRYSMYFEPLHGGRAVYVGGYTGFGVSGTRFGARIGLALLKGEKAPELELDIVRKKPAMIPPEPFRWIGARITLAVLKDVDTKGGWRLWWIRFVNFLGYPI